MELMRRGRMYLASLVRSGPGAIRGLTFLCVVTCLVIRAFSSEAGTGSREENASKQESRASVLIQSEPIML